MKVKITYLSVFRDITGKREEEVEFPGNTVADLLRHLAERYPGMKEWLDEEEYIVLVNDEPSGPARTLREGDAVAIMPPAAGGGGQAFVEKVEPEKLLESTLAVGDEETGAVAVFVGRVKGVVDGKRVESLFYEAYEPHATRALERIAAEEKEKSGVKDIYIYHKKGLAKPGEPVLFIAVASKGRKEAIETLARVLERVKHEPYVWKLERREDGEFWIVGSKKTPRPNP